MSCQGRLRRVGSEELLVFGIEAGNKTLDQQQLALNDFDVIFHRSSIVRGGIFISRYVHHGADAEDCIPGTLLLRFFEFFLQGVDAGVLLSGVVGHVGERAGGLSGLPAYVVEFIDAECDRHGLVLMCFRGFDHVVEDRDIVLQIGLLLMNVVEDILQAPGVALDLGVKAGFGFVDEMAVMLPLDAAFKAEGDEKADGDGQDMKQEIAPAMNGFMRGMDVEHGGDLVCGIHWGLA